MRSWAVCCLLATQQQADYSRQVHYYTGTRKTAHPPYTAVGCVHVYVARANFVVRILYQVADFRLFSTKGGRECRMMLLIIRRSDASDYNGNTSQAILLILLYQTRRFLLIISHRFFAVGGVCPCAPSWQKKRLREKKASSFRVAWYAGSHHGDGDNMSIE